MQEAHHKSALHSLAYSFPHILNPSSRTWERRQFSRLACWLLKNLNHVRFAVALKFFNIIKNAQHSELSPDVAISHGAYLQLFGVYTQGLAHGQFSVQASLNVEHCCILGQL